MSDLLSAGLSPEIILTAMSAVAIRVSDDLTVREVSGSAFDVQLETDVREAIPALYGMEDVLRDGPPISIPFVQLNDDTTPPVTVSSARDSRTGALWLVLRDVSEESEVQRQLVQNHNALSLAEAELRAARDAALAADRTKTAFLANVSHELRTPLHVIIGGASILSKPRGTALDTDEVVGYASDMHESGVLLLQLVDDLIDLSRSETGDLTLYEEWCDLNEIVDKMVALGKDLPDAAGIALAAEHVAKAPRMFADGRRIKQILLNLISNAIKAVTRRENGEVCVSVERYEDGTACLIVQDNGPGMSADELAVAREPFGQPRAAVRSKGAGLGLAIVDRLAKLHGGELIITTAPGEGLRALVHFDATRFNTE